MNHEYIDLHDIAGQYLRKELSPADHAAFQAHLVDCPECADRVLLAGMFLSDRPEPLAPEPLRQPPPPNFVLAEPRLPLRARVVAYLTPWQLAMLLLGAVLVLLSVVGLLFWWELRNVRP